MHASHPGNAADTAVASDRSRTEVSLIELGELPELQVQGPSLLDGRLDLIGDVKVRLRPVLGQGDISVAELFALKDGSVVPLQCGVHPLVDIELDQKTIARGELVVVGNTLGVRVMEVGRGPA